MNDEIWIRGKKEYIIKVDKFTKQKYLVREILSCRKGMNKNIKEIIRKEKLIQYYQKTLKNIRNSSLQLV